MPERDPTISDIQTLVTEFSEMERHHQIPGTERHENNVEHSYSVALMCWYVFDKVRPPDLDLSKILKYALIHDLPEVPSKSGDVNTFASPEERLQKDIDEREAIEFLSERFASFEDFSTSLNEYFEQANPETIFVRTVDKMQALILGDLDDWRPYMTYEGGISYSKFCEKFADLLNAASPYVSDIFECLIEYSKTTYYDQPK
jgi:5'-deoxynucleotidase YfbR-like HD superfamily hydrolase